MRGASSSGDRPVREPIIERREFARRRRRVLDEVGEGVEVRVATTLLDLDDKRFHLFHAMYDGDRLLAEAECMLLHVDMSGPKAAPFAPEIAAKLQAVFEAHGKLPRPERAGRSIGIRRKG